KRVRQILSWSTRYSDVTLTAGYFFRPDADGTRQLYSATQDIPAFAADPLLLGLFDRPPALGTPSETSTPGVTPQFPGGLPLTQLRDRGLTDGLVSTALGMFPRPSAQRASATRRAAKGTRLMNRYRWWLLQLLDLATAVLGNIPRRTPAQTVLALQRIALL